MATTDRYGVTQGIADTAEKAKETATAATEKAKEMARKAGEVAGNVGHKAEESVGAVGTQMKSLAGTIREKSPHEGMMGNAGCAVADTLDRAGNYLEEQKLRGMLSDLGGVIQRHPVPVILLSLGIGFMVGRAAKRG